MGEYLSPAVYVEEVSSGSKPIAGVGTSTGAFVGIAEKGPIGKAELVTNWAQFEKKFGGFIDDGVLAHAVYQFFNEGGTKCYVVRTCHYLEPSDRTTMEAVSSATILKDENNNGTIRVAAVNEGTWGDKLSVSVEHASNSRELYKLLVKQQNAKGMNVIVEAFDNLSVEQVEETINGKSDYISVEEDNFEENGQELLTGKGNKPWIAKFAQSVVLSGGVDADNTADPVVVEAKAEADLRDSDFSKALTVTAKTAGTAANDIIVTVSEGTSTDKFTLTVSKKNKFVETFKDLDLDNLTINSDHVELSLSEGNTTNLPWILKSPQKVVLDGTQAHDVIYDEAGVPIVNISARTPFVASDISLQVEPGTQSGFTIYIKHKDGASELFEDVSLAKVNNNGIVSTLVNLTLAAGITLPSDRVPWPRKTDDVSPLYQYYVLTGGTDGLTDPMEYTGNATAMTGLHAFDNVDDINLVAIPDAGGAATIMKDGLTYCELRKDCFFIADPLDELNPQEVLAHKLKYLKSSYGALYYPWIESIHPVSRKKILLPPSGAVAGIISKTDIRRGVFKAPAGTAEGYVRSAVGLEKVLTKGEHDILNNPGINVIREFPGTGICVWGARTLTDDPEWKYVNVRRLFLFIEESIDEGTQWVVFEPNDPSLWGSVKRNITAFLTILWRDGALFGATPDEAFFVKVDAENNPPEVRDLGQLIIEIGVAPVKPAEFVIIRIQQKTLTK